MHTHVSALTAGYVFLLVAIAGTGWRLLSGYLAVRGGIPGAFGGAMSFQY